MGTNRKLSENVLQFSESTRHNRAFKRMLAVDHRNLRAGNAAHGPAGRAFIQGYRLEVAAPFAGYIDESTAIARNTTLDFVGLVAGFVKLGYKALHFQFVEIKLLLFHFSGC
ncbi:MAG: hypothetical protein H7Z75_04540 [Ferruginibacter sp.]|nr:hypothetical protein [Cytophagales bacterium]